jgi:O-antigen/teichoic acid export membrane protein
MLAGLLGGVIAVGDRYAIGYFLGVGEVAVYVATLKLSNGLNLAAAPLNLWFPSARYRHVSDPDNGARFFYGVLASSLIIMLALAGAIYFVGPHIFHLFAPGLTWDSALASCLLLSAVAAACNPLMNVGLLKEGKTHLIPIIAGCVAVVQLILLMLLVPVLGYRGAGVALVVSQFVNLSTTFIVSQKIHVIDWRLKRIVLILLIFFVAMNLASWAEVGFLGRALLFLGVFVPSVLVLHAGDLTQRGRQAAVAGSSD